MVKPALAYLDVVARVRNAIDLPVCAYNVSGEYTMVKLMGQSGCGSEEGIDRGDISPRSSEPAQT